jgi:methionyl-tRNA synthetase
MGDYALHHALAEIWRVVADANRYFASEEPWAKRKTDPERMNTILWTTAEVIRNVAIMAQPFIPAAAGKLLDLVGSSADARAFASVGEGGRISGGLALPAPQPVFPRYVEAEEGDKPKT